MLGVASDIGPSTMSLSLMLTLGKLSLVPHRKHINLSTKRVWHDDDERERERVKENEMEALHVVCTANILIYLKSHPFQSN